MKKLIVLFLLVTSIASAQKTLYLKHYKDKMTDQEAIVSSHNLNFGDREYQVEILCNVIKTKGKLKFNAMLIDTQGFGRLDKAEMIILFEDQTKISLFSKNSSSDGLLLMDCTEDIFSTLNKPIEAIRVTNLENGYKYTHDMKSSFEINYMKDLNIMIANNIYTTIK